MKKTITLFSILMILSGCGEKIHYEMGECFRTYVEIKIIEKDEKKAKQVIEEIFKELKNIEKTFSPYDKTSHIYQLNLKGQITANKEILDLFSKSLYFSQITNGAFDITVFPLVKLWKKVKETKKLPTKNELTKVLEKINYRFIKIEKNKIYFEKKGMSVDFGGIGKGYAVDQAVKILKKHKIKKALVNIGGNSYGYGKNWKIGLQHPRKPYGNILKIFNLKDKGISTSGDYEKFFFLDGKKYHHILNPKTGFPADKCISVTIIADDATTADALSTGVFVLGPKEGIKLLKKLKIKGVIIDSFEKMITIN